MIRYLLDTNIVSDLVRSPGGVVRDRLLERADVAAVYTSVIVAAELKFGVSKRQSSRMSRQLTRILSEIEVQPFRSPMDDVYGRLRAELERAGTPIGRNDLLIAAQAVHDESVLVTDNVREFGRVRGLKVENWLRA